MGLKINLASHNFNRTNSILSIIPIYTDLVIETRYNNKILQEMVTIYARLIKINISLNIIFQFQLAFIRLTKKIKEVIKLKCLLT